MPRHWRCAKGHAWTGELGALTYCPDCGSADVFEVRPKLPADEPEPAAAASDRTFVQPAGDPRADSAAAIGDTLIQAPAAPADAGDTLIQPAPAAAADDTYVQLGADEPAEADGSTTLIQVYVPAPDAGGTVVPPGDSQPGGPAADGGTLVQAPVPAGPAADGPTVLAP